MTTKQIPGRAELWKHIDSFRYSAFRLETLQVYAGSGEDEGIAAFHRGDPAPPPDPRQDTFAARLRRDRAAGKTWQRVHVITEPITSYLAYELTWEYGPHVAAGEDIRIVPVAGDWPADVPETDFWLFDSRYRLDLRYDPDGLWLGVELVTDLAAVAAACAVRDAAWHQSVPWAEYMTRHPALARRAPKGA